MGFKAGNRLLELNLNFLQFILGIVKLNAELVRAEHVFSWGVRIIKEWMVIGLKVLGFIIHH